MARKFWESHELLPVHQKTSWAIPYLENALVDAHEGDIEGAAAQIENEDGGLLLGLLVEAVGNGGRSGLHNTKQNAKERFNQRGRRQQNGV